MDYLDLLISKRKTIKMLRLLAFLFPVLVITYIVFEKQYDIPNFELKLLWSIDTIYALSFFCILSLIAFAIEDYILPFILILTCKKISPNSFEKTKAMAIPIILKIKGSHLKDENPSKHEVFCRITYLPVVLILWLIACRINIIVLIVCIVVILITTYLFGRVLNTIYIDEESLQNK